MVAIHLKDGQEPPKQIHYRLGGFKEWNFSEFVSESTERAYKRGLTKKTRVSFVDGLDNNLLSLIGRRDGEKFLKADHRVEVYGYVIMPIIWKPSGKVRFAMYTSRDTTLYRYLKKEYPSGSWMSGEPPVWVRKK